MQRAVTDFREVGPLLGSPLSEGDLEKAIETAKNNIDRIGQRNLFLDIYTTMFSKTHYVSATQLTYLLWSAPDFKLKHKLSRIDELSRATYCLKNGKR